MLSNSISTLVPGQGCRAELLDERGHITGDLRVYVTKDDVRIDVEPGLGEAIRATLEKFVIMDDVTIADVTAQAAHFTIAGPKIAEFVAALGGEIPAALWSNRFGMLGGVGT